MPLLQQPKAHVISHEARPRISHSRQVSLAPAQVVLLAGRQLRPSSKARTRRACKTSRQETDTLREGAVFPLAGSRQARGGLARCYVCICQPRSEVGHVKATVLGDNISLMCSKHDVLYTSVQPSNHLPTSQASKAVHTAYTLDTRLNRTFATQHAYLLAAGICCSSQMQQPLPRHAAPAPIRTAGHNHCRHWSPPPSACSWGRLQAAAHAARRMMSLLYRHAAAMPHMSKGAVLTPDQVLHVCLGSTSFHADAVGVCAHVSASHCCSCLSPY